MLHAGIVGLPNVGKSTLFNTLTKSNVMSGNYMFATTEANFGTVSLPDRRLDVLATMHKSKKIVPTTVEFVDIPGLVSGSSQGEGLGNQFLGSIRDTDAICHVIRCFHDDNVMHVNNKIDPINDIITVQLELNYADLDSVTKRIPKLEKKALVGGASDDKLEYDTLKKIEKALTNDTPIRLMGLDKEEERVIKSYNFLSQKPMLYVANLDESSFKNLENDPLYQSVLKQAEIDQCGVVAICAKFEQELAGLDEVDQKIFMEDLGITESSLNYLIRITYHTLGLETYFTTGEDETRAWTFKTGMTAPQCAGIIHSDFERGFIRAETVSFSDLEKYGSHQKCKEAGKVRLEGKDYKVKDGDVMLFRFNV